VAHEEADVRFRVLCVIALVVAPFAPVRGQTPTRRGGEFQINTYTTYFQLKPVAATGTEGDFLVVWRSSGSFGTDTSSSSIQGQRFTGEGTPIGGEFQINTFTTGNQEEPALALLGSGGFIVVWDSDGSVGSDNSEISVQGQRLDADGELVGGQFQINTFTSSSQEDPEVAANAEGGFVVAWESFGSAGTDTDAFSIQGQRFDSDGNRVGSQFQVNTYTPSSQLAPRISASSNGDFLVVWSSLSGGGADTSNTAILGQRFDSMGLPVGGELLVNSYTTGSQLDPDLVLGAAGEFIAVWSSPGGSFGNDDSYSSIQAQRLESTGVPTGDQFQVNSYTSLNQVTPTLASDPQGYFVVAWEDFNSPTDGSYSAVEAQRFDTAGNRVGNQFEVNTYTFHLQHEISVAVQPSGDFLVVWESRGSYGSDTSYSSIQGQLYALPILVDGFESGDTSAWSSTAP